MNNQEFTLKTPQNKESLQALWRLLKILMSNLEFNDVINKVVNAVLDELGNLYSGYRIVVLSLNDGTGLRRIALSETQEAKRATSVSTIPFEKIVIPLNATSNFGIRVLNEGKPLVTTSWPDILTPPLTQEAALTNQHAAGIKTSLVYPIYAETKPIGTLIFSMIKSYSDMTDDEKELLVGFADLVGLAVHNSMLYTSVRESKDNLARVNQEVFRMNERLHELDKLKDDFVSVASHELRTPMTAIRSYVWMAINRSDIPLSERLKRYLNRTLISTERLINLVNDMLNISRIESGKVEITPKAFDLKALVDDVYTEIAPKAAEKSLHIQVLGTQLPEVFADPDKVHQVLLNLLGNAMKFTPNNGVITISFFSDGYVVETSVKDTGVGISKDDQHRLFQKFGRLDNSYVASATSGGTGLGLFISKSLVELMKGRIWANSEGVGKGSTFTFSLPVARQEVVSQAEKFTRKVDEGSAKQLEPVAL